MGEGAVPPPPSHWRRRPRCGVALGWERGLYHRPPPIGAGAHDPESVEARAIAAGMDASPSDALGTCHGIILHHVSRLLGGAGPEGRRLAEDLVAAGAASSDAAFLRSLYEHLLGTGEAETVLRIDSPSLENWLLEEKKDVPPLPL